MSKSQLPFYVEEAGKSITRAVPVGAELQANGNGTHFRVWAPEHASVRLIVEGRTPLPLNNEGNGYFSLLVDDVQAGAKYKYELDGKDACPDPASRFQPNGPHGVSEVIDPTSFRWTDTAWPGVELAGQVVYEMHLGTFTPDGTWNSATEKLHYLRDTGITLLEVMPVADFPGKFGWGYDGVQPYAPASTYGTPDDMRAFVNQAHSLGIGVILDVVYNHLGPDGNYLPSFSPYYLTEKHQTDWGQGINFDGKESGPVREFFRENAAYWIREFHLDGLRLDATQDIHDDSEPHIIVEISEAARKAADPRPILLIGENEPQNTDLIKAVANGGVGLDALWNDDYHHSAMVALTGKADAYYSDYRGRPQEFISAMKYGYLYQGQWYRWQKKRRGSSNLGSPRSAMVTFIQNHDQVANSARGQRAHELSAPGVLKAMTALTLLGPGTPMLFQGQEFAASSPFLFFADHKPDLAKLIRKGRAEFLEQWRSLRLPDIKKCFKDPCSEDTFLSSKLDFSEVEKHSEIYALHQDLLRLRREDPILSRQGEYGIDGAVLSDSAFVLRYFSPEFESDRLLVVNLGIDLELNPAPEPLLAPPADTGWKSLWSSDDARYGGSGTAPLDSKENWRIPGQATVVLHPKTIA
ncbi:MAG: malto-oligosyltrehalose trehalohydrolase [Acidobacteriota bacterium]|nr:malto-oligosyltrehalose trehalohydrolase [Acidobacteriota bacterium]